MRFIRSSADRGAYGHSRRLFAVARCLPFVALVTVITIEFSPAHVIYTGPLLSPAAALAAVTMGPLGTSVVGLLAIGVSSTTATVNHAWGTQQVYANMTALLLVAIASVVGSTVRVRRTRELTQVRRIAEVSQNVVLRPLPNRMGMVTAASVYLAAERGAQIGGDLYEAMTTRFGVRLIVGDVRGKGLAAVRSAAAVLGAFREAVHYESDLAEVMHRCAAALQREYALLDRTDPRNWEEQAEQFVTVLLAQVPDDATIQLINRGHPPPLIVQGGCVRPLAPTRPLPPLGLEEFLTGPPIATESYPFASGERLLLHTDGVLEARNRSHEFFPLWETLEILDGATPEEYLDRLRQALVRHAEGHLADDAAMILIERADGSPGAGPPGDP
ncbi:PP2C family protein-serine/threonine phosphatase [Streptomyces sp. ME19-01-6]|uniref:PP2C family protein-serine/threonine phosphatase n=1 Tax=Streptomyces sp. ME19-01-6 TaxID=3028686 RepID=UPI0029A4BB01|nr:PP2C family protein-serine/threonine phosphatase [Streptomyces sp. ME19-01-6]MDX3232140.1 PP2C family protein-serine/threonine phosphatase [Streptomyces sp. ME19-01-6]